jgi:hypothetical protein
MNVAGWGGVGRKFLWTVCSSLPERTASQPRVVCTSLITVTLRASSLLLVGYRAFSTLQHVLTILPQNLEMAKVWQCESEVKLTSLLLVCGTKYATIFHDLLSRITIPYGGGIPIVETLWKCRLQSVSFLYSSTCLVATKKSILHFIVLRL